MYEETYDEYIRSILGYPSQANMYNINRDNTEYNLAEYTRNSELENCYPEIYKILYPMVKTACINNTNPVNEQTVENMTDDIYFAVESNNNIGININLTNDIKKVATKQENRVELKGNIENKENRQVNRGLRDLIKILILRELLNRPSNRPPVRPPFYGRSPIMPRYYDNNSIYEML